MYHSDINKYVTYFAKLLYYAKRTVKLLLLTLISFSLFLCRWSRLMLYLPSLVRLHMLLLLDYFYYIPASLNNPPPHHPITISSSSTSTYHFPFMPLGLICISRHITPTPPRAFILCFPKSIRARVFVFG